MTASKGEQQLADQLTWAAKPQPVTEYRFAKPDRQWRFDFAWPDRMVAVEVEGGGFVAGRHTRGQGYADDAVKYNEAALRGWLVIRVVPAQIRSGEALVWIERALALGGRKVHQPDDRDCYAWPGSCVGHAL